MADFMTYKDQV